MSVVTCKMSFKGTITFFLITLDFLQANGCFTEDTNEPFYRIDSDQNGYASYEEFCPTLQTRGMAGTIFGDEEGCDELWNSFDLNSDDKVTCQESFVAEMIKYLDMLSLVEFGDSMKMVFADKPENCTKISDEELVQLIMPDPDTAEMNEEVKNQVYQIIDKNGDGDLACNEILPVMREQISQITKNNKKWNQND